MKAVVPLKRVVPILFACLVTTTLADHPQYPPQRPARKTPAAAEGKHIIKPVRLTIVLANRSFRGHTFQVDTGLSDATSKGFRFTPDNAGENCRDAETGTLSGSSLASKIPDMVWEFWEQQ